MQRESCSHTEVRSPTLHLLADERAGEAAEAGEQETRRSTRSKTLALEPSILV